MDGDTSTNDCVIGLASGAAGNAVIMDAGSADGKKLEAALTALLQGLAKSIAWDGEGATCLMEISVVGAKTDADARKVVLGGSGVDFIWACPVLKPLVMCFNESTAYTYKPCVRLYKPCVSCFLVLRKVE